MKIVISGTREQKGLLEYQSLKARNLLLNLQESFGSENGFLKVMHTNKSSENMTLESKGWWQLWALRASKMRATKQVLEKLFEHAYKDPIDDLKCSEHEKLSLKKKYDDIVEKFNTSFRGRKPLINREKFDGVMRDFQGFWSHVSSLADKEIKKDNPAQKNDAIVTPPEINLISQELSVFRGKSMEQVLSPLLKPVLFKNALGQGAFGAAYKAETHKGESVVVKKMMDTESSTNMCQLTPSALIRGELVGLRLGKIPGVAKATGVVVRKGEEYEYIPLQPRREVKGYLKTLADQGKPYWSIVGLVMPLAAGKPLQNMVHDLRPEGRKAVAKQGVETLKQLHDHGIVHRDIKPENMLYDAKNKKITYIDFGISAKISRIKTNKQGEEEKNRVMELKARAGTAPFSHPSVLVANGQYGPEVDMFSFAMTQLQIATGGHDSSKFMDEVFLTRVKIVPPPVKYEDNNEFIKYIKNHPNQSYLRNLLEQTKNEITKKNPSTTASRDALIRFTKVTEKALKKLDKGDLEMKFIEEAFAVAMIKPDWTQKTRNEIYKNYYTALGELQKNDYLK